MVNLKVQMVELMLVPSTQGTALYRRRSSDSVRVLCVCVCPTTVLACVVDVSR